jgi:hypothetical protein
VLAVNPPVPLEALIDAVRALPTGAARHLLADEHGWPCLDLTVVADRIGAMAAPLALADLLSLDVLEADPAYEWTTRAALLAIAARRAWDAAGMTPPARIEAGDLVIGDRERVVVSGSLEVAGRIVLHEGARLIVAGDVRATDLLEYDGATFAGYHGALAVAGDARFAGLCSTGGNCVVAGRLTAPVILAYYNQGRLLVTGGVETELLVEYDHGGSAIWGESRVVVPYHDELRGFDPELRATWEQVLEQLSPPLRALAPADDVCALEVFVREHALARHLLASGAA